MGDATPGVPQLDMSTAVSDSDHGVVVAVVCWLCLVASFLFFGARLRIRWPLPSLFGQDDTACTIAMGFATIQTALVLFAANSGFGTQQDELSSDRVEYLEKIVWTSDLFYILSLCCSKMAVACLFRRFSAQPERIRMFEVFMAAVGVYGVIGLLITALRQNTLRPWAYSENTMPSILQRWIAFGVIGIALDVVALMCPLYLLWGVQIDRRPKIRVTLAFAPRAPIIVFTALRMVALSKLSGRNVMFAYVTPEVYTQLEMHYSLIAATIPCLRIFLKAWNTSFLAMGLENMDEQAYNQHTVAKGTYAMDSVRISKNSKKAHTSRFNRGHGMRSKGPWLSRKDGVSQATIGGGRQDGDAASENSQKAIVVKHTVDVDVR